MVESFEILVEALAVSNLRISLPSPNHGCSSLSSCFEKINIHVNHLEYPGSGIGSPSPVLTRIPPPQVVHKKSRLRTEGQSVLTGNTWINGNVSRKGYRVPDYQYEHNHHEKEAHFFGP